MSLYDVPEHVAESMLRWRRDLHRRAEIGLDLPRTRGYVREVLEEIGIAITSGPDELFITARIPGGGSGPTLLLRADMDALPLEEASGSPCVSDTPGVMHACGHDAHTAMLLGAARMLHDARDTLRGDVVLAFQPGEEGHGGCALMVEVGLCHGIDAAFALHVAPQLPVGFIGGRPGTQMASSNPFEVIVRGAGGHGSTARTQTNPLLSAARTALDLAEVDQAEGSGAEDFLISVTQLASGAASNVIADTAVIRGTIRAHSARGDEAGRAAIERVVAGSADTEVVWPGPFAPVLENDPALFAHAAEAAAEVTGGGFLPMAEPLTSSEDFALIAERVPATMLFLGAGSQNAALVHTPQFRLDEGCLVVGAAMHTAFARRLLS